MANERKFVTTILTKKADHIPPKELLETLMKHHPSGMGMAFVNDSIVQVGTMIGKKRPTTKDVLEGMEQTKHLSMLLSFHNFPSDADVNDYQPFQVTTDKTVACVVDGEFIEFIQPKSKRSNHFFFLQEMVIPKFTQLMRLCKNDVEAVMAEITASQPIITKDLLTKGKRGIVSILSTSGPIITLSLANDKAHEAEWGYVSNIFDWKPPVAITQTEERVEASNKFLAAFGDSKEEQEEVEEKPEAEEEEEDKPVEEPEDAEERPVEEEEQDEEKAEPEQEDHEAREAAQSKEAERKKAELDKDATVINLAKYRLDVKGERVACPDEITSKSGKKKWYRTNFEGSCPSNYEERPWKNISSLGKGSPVLKALFAAGLDKQLKTMPKVLKSLENLDVLAQRPTVGKDNKSERPTKDTPVAKGEAVEIPEDAPVISAAAKKEILGTFLKKEFRDGFGKVIPNPAEVQKGEKEFGTFMSQLGIKSLEDTLDWPVDYLAHLGALDIKALAILCRTVMNRVIVVQGRKTEDKVIEAFTRKAG